MSKAARRKDPQGKGKIQEWRGEEGCRRRGSSGSHTERPKFSSCSGEQGGRRKGSSAASHKRQGLKSRGVKKAAGGGKLQAALAYDITCKSSGSEQGGRWRRTLITSHAQGFKSGGVKKVAGGGGASGGTTERHKVQGLWRWVKETARCPSSLQGTSKPPLSFPNRASISLLDPDLPGTLQSTPFMQR